MFHVMFYIFMWSLYCCMSLYFFNTHHLLDRWISYLTHQKMFDTFRLGKTLFFCMTLLVLTYGALACISTSMGKITIWLVVWNIFIFPHIGNDRIPTDFHSIIFQRGRLNHQPTMFDLEFWIFVDLLSLRVTLFWRTRAKVQTWGGWGVPMRI